jgi:hypothetical protein
MIEKKKKYSVPIWGEVRFSIEVYATSEGDAVGVAYTKEEDFDTLMTEAMTASTGNGSYDVFWDSDRTLECVGMGDIEEVDV